jgi:hypothetical protein
MSIYKRLTGQHVQEISMKTYAIPQLATKGSVVKMTETVIPGSDDPFDRIHLVLAMPGSVGFQL